MQTREELEQQPVDENLSPNAEAKNEETASAAKAKQQ